MGKFDLQKDFIDYWDEVVRQWLINDADCSFTGVVEDQCQIIQAINGTIGKNANYTLNTKHMPEPYWGDPLKCSIVLLDYNPAGGPEPNRHTTIDYKNGDEKGMSFIKFVNDNNYSCFARKCPVFRDADDLNNNGLNWFSAEKNMGGYEGYKWWQRKRGWLDHLVEAVCGKKDEKVLPFGMELCGWHSKNWSNNMKWINNCHDAIDKRAIHPLFAAMKKSLIGRIAVCIGAEFKPSILENFFINNEGDFDVTQCMLIALENKRDILREKGYRILTTEEINAKPRLSEESKKSIGVAVKKNKEEETTRYYRVYNVVEKGENHIIFNTHAPGGNRHPAPDFWEFENILLKAIRDNYSIK